MKKSFYLFSCLIIFILTGCTYVKGYVDMGKDRGLSDEYFQSLGQWTRDMTGHSQFETKFYISATYRSQAFNDAYLKEQARIRQWPDQETRKREEIWKQLSSDYVEFLVYAFTDNMEANDFDARNSVWSVFLIDGKGKRYEPLEIRKIDRITTEMEAFFPFINKYYGKGYIMKFPVIESPQDMKLVFSSILGRIDLEWKANSNSKSKR